MRIKLILASAMIAATAPAVAQDVGLFIGNEDYQQMQDVRRGDRLVSGALDQAGVDGIVRTDATLEDTIWALSEFGQRIGQADSLIVQLSGRFVHTATETYFMPVDEQPGPLATLAQRSIPLSSVFAMLTSQPERAILLLATDDASDDFSDLITIGLGDLDVPENITVVIGAPRDMRRFVRGGLDRRGKPYLPNARRYGLTVLGFSSDTHIILGAQRTPPPLTIEDRRQDILSWRNASEINTAEAYQAYLENHPRGEFIRMAENRIQALTNTPEARAERAEQSLDLSRQARRAIQRDLSLLGYDTRGIDGIFGRGTRAAIAGWQSDQRLTSTGFLSQEEIEELDRQADVRAAELEAEAERRRQEQLAADIDYWDRTGSSGSEDGLRQYLARFPDGEFAEVAQTRLDSIERDRLGRASSADRRLWDQVRQYDTIPAYEEYLRRASNGAFREDALLRIEELEGERENSARQQAAIRGEQSLNLSGRTRQIIEARLNGLDLKPGPVDGVFDDDTRRALRRYQAARNMEETGYLSEAVVVQLLADTVRQIFR